MIKSREASKNEGIKREMRKISYYYELFLAHSEFLSSKYAHRKQKQVTHSLSTAYDKSISVAVYLEIVNALFLPTRQIFCLFSFSSLRLKQANRKFY